MYHDLTPGQQIKAVETLLAPREDVAAIAWEKKDTVLVVFVGDNGAGAVRYKFYPDRTTVMTTENVSLRTTARERARERKNQRRIDQRKAHEAGKAAVQVGMSETEARLAYSDGWRSVQSDVVQAVLDKKFREWYPSVAAPKELTNLQLWRRVQKAGNERGHRQ